MALFPAHEMGYWRCCQWQVRYTKFILVNTDNQGQGGQTQSGH
jgi:hypothetical protein